MGDFGLPDLDFIDFNFGILSVWGPFGDKFVILGSQVAFGIRTSLGGHNIRISLSGI